MLWVYIRKPTIISCNLPQERRNEKNVNYIRPPLDNQSSHSSVVLLLSSSPSRLHRDNDELGVLLVRSLADVRTTLETNPNLPVHATIKEFYCQTSDPVHTDDVPTFCPKQLTPLTCHWNIYETSIKSQLPARYIYIYNMTGRDTLDKITKGRVWSTRIDVPIPMMMSITNHRQAVVSLSKITGDNVQ